MGGRGRGGRRGRRRGRVEGSVLDAVAVDFANVEVGFHGRDLGGGDVVGHAADPMIAVGV